MASSSVTVSVRSSGLWRLRVAGQVLAAARLLHLRWAPLPMVVGGWAVRGMVVTMAIGTRPLSRMRATLEPDGQIRLVTEVAEGAP